MTVRLFSVADKMRSKQASFNHGLTLMTTLPK
jgi:hypothetical protein